MTKILKAEIAVMTSEAYEDVPPPSNTFRFSLFRRGESGEFVFCDAVDVGEGVRECRFTVTQSGEYQAHCQRLSVQGLFMGSQAVSSSCYIGSGTYSAPLVLTLALSAE